MTPLDHAAVTRELMRALRGSRSQVAFARRLGYRTNVAHAWERGHRTPTAADVFRVAERLGVDVRSGLGGLFREAPTWLRDLDPTTPAGVGRLLDGFRGPTSAVELAARLGRSRFTVSRWVRGETSPPFPDFLSFVEVTTYRTLDLLAVLVDPASLPSVAPWWSELEALRRAAYEAPWTQAVLRALETRAYQAAPHRPGWLADRLGLTADEEDEALSLLVRSGQATLRRGRYTPVEELRVEAPRDPLRGPRLRAFWSRVAADRAAAGADGRFAYLLGSVSEADYERLRSLLLQTYEQVRGIVGSSQPPERVVLVNLQALALDRRDP